MFDGGDDDKDEDDDDNDSHRATTKVEKKQVTNTANSACGLEWPFLCFGPSFSLRSRHRNFSLDSSIDCEGAAKHQHENQQRHEGHEVGSRTVIF